MTPGRPRFEERDADWLGVDEALRRILDGVEPLPAEEIGLDQALGRALAEPLAARATLPPWDNSAMDGYAVRGTDVSGASDTSPVRLDVTGEVRAGDLPDTPVEPGHAVRIMTGAPMPPGADSVVRVEHTDAEAGEPGVVQVRSDHDRGGNVRPGGQDMTAEETVLERGATLTPGVLAVASALGHARIPVTRRPAVAVLSSGDELRTLERFDDVVAGRGVPETNGPALLAALRGCGAREMGLGIARDDPTHIRDRVGAAFEADLLVTSGGASMGEADLFKRVLVEMGLQLDFWRVRIRPGSPLSLGRLPRPDGSSLPVLGLPGNPASAFVTFEIFVRPLVLRLAGHRRIHRRTLRATAGERLGSRARLTHFHRVTLDGGPAAPVARLAGHPGSGLVRSLGRADGLGVVPEGRSALEPGDPVQVILLDDGPAPLESVGYRTVTE